MRSKNFTTEGTEKKKFSFFKSSVNPMLASSKNVEKLKDTIKDYYYESAERGA